MAATIPPALIGVDGGGTSCRFALLRGGQRVEITLGGANVFNKPDAAIVTLRAGLAALAEKAGLTARDLAECPAHLGLAGILNPGDADAVAARLSLPRIRISDDRYISVVGALGASDGAVIGIGTGSFVARQSGGAVDYVGGWGLTLGDEGSGAWLGRRILARTLLALDGLAPSTALTESLLAEMDGGAGLVRFAKSASAAGFAALAPRILAAAGDGDEASLSLLKEGADYVDRGLRRLGWNAAEPLCALGGLASSYAPYLRPDIAGALVPPKGTALDGALHLAAQLARDSR